MSMSGCRKGHILSRSSQSWPLRTSTTYEEFFHFQAVVLLGPCSSAPFRVNVEDDVNCISESTGSEARGARTGASEGTDTVTVISTLISASRLPRFRLLLSSIFTSPAAIDDPSPHVIRVTESKGLGMFATRDIRKGELIAWERPAVIVPGLEKNQEMSQEVYRIIAEGFLEVENESGEGETRLAPVEVIREAGKQRLADIRSMAISNTVGGGHWLEGIVRTNAVVLEFEDGLKLGKGDKREIYGGIYPLINRCNHSCVPTAAVHFMPAFLTLCLYALRDIKAREEVTKSYVNPLLPRETRRKTLRENYGFECDCRSCTLSPANSTLSDERRSQLANMLSTPTFSRWQGDLARADDFLAEKHRWALRLVEEEQVWEIEGVFMEEIALAFGIMGDRDGFRTWARKVIDAGKWKGQIGELPEGEEVKGRDGWRKWVWWYEDPERRVKKWGWRKMMREEMSRRKGGVDLEVGMLEDIFGHTER